MITHTAPKSKFRIIGYDSFDNDQWKVGDYATLDEAKKEANKRGGQMTIMYVHNDKGEIVHRSGSY